VFENRVLRIFGQKRDEVTGGSRKLHNEEIRIIRMIKSMRIRWAGHVGRIGEKNAYRILVEKPEGKRPLGRPRQGGLITLKWILKRQDGVVWTGLIWLKIGASIGLR
jgi:hypothetical protein